MRDDHLLTSPRPCGYPTQVVFLDADTVPADGDGVGKVVRHALASWQAISIRGAGGQYGPPKRHGGRTVASFWDQLCPRLARSGQITCVSSRAILTWGVLDLWDRLTERSVELVGTGRAATHPGPGPRKGPPPGACVCDGLPTIIDFRLPRGPGKCRILDVRNWWAGELDPSYTAAGRADWCYHYYLAMVARCREHRLGGLKPTVASQAYHAWRGSYKGHMVRCHNDERVLSIEREGYYSGRAECFRLGAVPGPVYHLDVSGQYRSLYATLLLPTCLMGVEREPDASAIPDILDSYGAIADVTVTTDEPAYPVRVNAPRQDDRFPHRGLRPIPATGRPRPSITIYPVGTFRTVLAGPELMDAVRLGRVQRWHWLAWYELAPALADYAECVSGLLDQPGHPPALRTWAKGLAVSVVGKLGQRDSHWDDAEWPHIRRAWEHWIEALGDHEYREWRSLGWRTQTRTGEGWAYDACPAMAAYVTSAARIQLMRAVRTAGRAHVHYCATDSVFLDRDGYEELGAAGMIDEAVPGYWRLEAVYDSMETKGIGHYVLDGITTCAGMPGSGTARAGTVHTARVSPTVMSACKAGHPPAPIDSARTYEGAGHYWHGVRLQDGRVAPHAMEDIV